jgi:alkanesulfonate monooxygenase SsuD/methylene tetrahydromethanopterin reductase-like flavin-dependent oxidoreductase (luciferase family)
MRETVRALRKLLDGERMAKGFRLRAAVPDATISVAAFGPAMTRVAAEEADEVVLNLVTPEHVAKVRDVVDAHAKAAGRAAPRISVWVTAALDPGPAALKQVSEQLAIYLRAPGYSDVFAELGFDTLVAQAKAGAPRPELAKAVPADLLKAVCAIGSAAEVARKIADYHRAGADHVGIAPSTAEDPAGRRVLTAVRHA